MRLHSCALYSALHHSDCPATICLSPQKPLHSLQATQQGTTLVYLILAIIVISTGVCWKLAKKKHLNVPFWIVMAALFGPLAIPFVALARDRSPAA